MNNLIPIADIDGLARDINSGAIVNTNTQQFVEYKKQKAIRQRQEEKLSFIEGKIETLEKNIEQIMGTLHKICEKLDGNS